MWSSSLVASPSCDLASFCTWTVPDTKPPEGSLGVSCGWSQRQKVGSDVKIFGKVMMGRVEFGACLKYPHWEDVYFIFVSGFSLDSRESALVGFGAGAPLWLFSPNSSLGVKPVQSAGWDCSFPVGYFFAKEQVTISFPSSNIVMSNHCFLSALGKIEKFLCTCLEEKVCQEEENI